MNKGLDGLEGISSWPRRNHMSKSLGNTLNTYFLYYCIHWCVIVDDNRKSIAFLLYRNCLDPQRPRQCGMNVCEWVNGTCNGKVIWVVNKSRKVCYKCTIHLNDCSLLTLSVLRSQYSLLLNTWSVLSLSSEYIWTQRYRWWCPEATDDLDLGFTERWPGLQVMKTSLLVMFTEALKSVRTIIAFTMFCFVFCFFCACCFHLGFVFDWSDMSWQKDLVFYMAWTLFL